MLDRAHGRVPNRNPFEFVDPREVEGAFAELRSLDHAAWAAAFGALANPHAERAREADGQGRAEAAKAEWLVAYNYERVARYPAPSSPAKLAAYARERSHYANAARYFDPPLEVVRIPFRGRPGEGEAVIALLRCPRGAGRAAVVVAWGGIDSYKEERRAEPFLEKGHAVLALDMPGAGEAPVKGSLDAERMWDAVFDWIAAREDLDAERIGLLGASTGGYWSTKLAHTHRARIRAAVNHGGPVHHAFAAPWIERSQQGDYPLEPGERLARARSRPTARSSACASSSRTRRKTCSGSSPPGRRPGSVSARRRRAPPAGFCRSARSSAPRYRRLGGTCSASAGTTPSTSPRA